MLRWASRNEAQLLGKLDSLADGQPSSNSRYFVDADNAAAYDTSAIDAILDDGDDDHISLTSGITPNLSNRYLVNNCIDYEPSHVTETTRYPKRGLDELGDYNSLYPLDFDECMRTIHSFRHPLYISTRVYVKNLFNNVSKTTATATSMLGSFEARFSGHERVAEYTARAIELSIVNTNYLRAIFCINFNKHGIAQPCLLQSKQDLLIHYVRTLILDGIELRHSTLIIDIIKLVKQRKICLQLISLRETKVSRVDYAANEICTALECTDSGFNNDEQSLYYHNLRPALGIYLFGKKDPSEPESEGRSHANTFIDSRNDTNDCNTRNGDNDKGIMSAIGAQLGSEGHDEQQLRLNSNPVNEYLNSQSRFSLPDNQWYQPTGMIDLDDMSSHWPRILQKINLSSNSQMPTIAFDAVLCRGPRHDPAWVEGLLAGGGKWGQDAKLDDEKRRKRPIYLKPKLATVALGPSGCVDCGTSPEGPASFPDSPVFHLPLLSPVPRFDGSVRNAQRPPRPFPPSSQDIKATNADAIQIQKPRLILRCKSCLMGRWCERCNRWWCESCFAGDLRRLKSVRNATPNQARAVKVVNGLCVERCLVPEMMSGAGSGGMWG